jgi:N-carbamoylputrescine amidase
MDGTAMATSNGTKRVALIQMSCDPDTRINLDKAAERVYEAARRGASII